PTAERSPTPRPTPEPRQPRTMTVDAAILPVPYEPGLFSSEWVRLRTRVTLLSSPSDTAQPVEVLQPGDAAHVYDPGADEAPEGWLQVETPISGWIFSEIDNDAMFERFSYRWRGSSAVRSVAAHTAGFTAFGYTADVQGELLLTSPDGVQWDRASAPLAAWGRSVAYGPAGWLMVGYLEQPDRPLAVVWQSADARDWQPVGTLPSDMADGINALAGTEAGYVLSISNGSLRPGIWFSGDGQLWTERPVDFALAERSVRVVATPLGFFAWSTGFGFDEPGGGFSTDGWTWSDAELIGRGEVIDVVADGDHLLALGRGPGGTMVWKGTIAGQRLTWSNDNTAPFRGAAVTRMVSDGDRVIALGWDRASEAPLWWERVGLSWEQHQLPAAFVGLPREAAAGPLGVVAVSQVDSAGGAAPNFWHLGAGEEWTREASPVMPERPPLTAKACGSAPRDVLALFSIDPLMAADCFGDAPITVRAWSVPCVGCSGQSDGEWETAWLAQPTERRIVHLSPTDNADWGTLEAVLHPSLPRQAPERPSRWVEVTGHYDDPEAASCRWIPTFMDEVWYSGTGDVVANCRARFVVTAIRNSPGP
ncbi:MAG TPA: hypothetical protein VF114_00330, partial [Candidatus Limnocylindria bacterium]